MKMYIYIELRGFDLISPTCLADDVPVYVSLV